MTVIDRIARFAGRPAATWTMAGWAAAEAIILPVVPDVGLCLLVLAAPRRFVRLFLALVAGALVGTLVLAAWSTAAPSDVEAMLLGLPGIHAAMLAGTDAAVADRGIAAFGQLGPGAPLKVYTVAWMGHGGDIAGLLAGTVINRLTRIGPALLLSAAVGWRLGGWIRRRERPFLVAYGSLWILVYLVYLA